MEEIEIPQYFICPISLQIMKDPVTAVTGITYERESIEQWLISAKRNTTTCPVTNQPLHRDSDLTPNHTLRRLIQAWCTANATKGVDRIPTPKASLDRTHVLKLVRELRVGHLYVNALKKMEALATENQRNKLCMAEAGVAKELCLLIMKCFREGSSIGLQEALRILHLIWGSFPKPEVKILVNENCDFIDSLTWALNCEIDNHVLVKIEAMLVLEKAIKATNSSRLERLRLEFFKTIIMVLRGKVLSQQAIKSALLVLIEACPLRRNRFKIVEAGAVFQLIELELEKAHEKNITELIFNVLAQLCSIADGREQLLRHAGSIAVLSKRILRVSPATDDRALHILSLIAKFSARNDVIQEMLRVGTVTKLCMVMQADCATYLKEKARGILKLHSVVWNNSPCIAVYLLTREQR